MKIELEKKDWDTLVEALRTASCFYKAVGQLYGGSAEDKTPRGSLAGDFSRSFEAEGERTELIRQKVYLQMLGEPLKE